MLNIKNRVKSRAKRLNKDNVTSERLVRIFTGMYGESGQGKRKEFRSPWFDEKCMTKREVMFES